jgi:hypothetical protein
MAGLGLRDFLQSYINSCAVKAVICVINVFCTGLEQKEI